MIQFSASATLEIAAAMFDYLKSMCEQDKLGGPSVHIFLSTPAGDSSSPTIMVSSRDPSNDRLLAIFVSRKNFDTPAEVSVLPLAKAEQTEEYMKVARGDDSRSWTGEFPAEEFEETAYHLAVVAFNYIMTGIIELNHTEPEAP